MVIDYEKQRAPSWTQERREWTDRLFEKILPFFLEELQAGHEWDEATYTAFQTASNAWNQREKLFNGEEISFTPPVQSETE